MNNKNQKLELTWIGKDNQPKLEPRILIEDFAIVLEQETIVSKWLRSASSQFNIYWKP